MWNFRYLFFCSLHRNTEYIEPKFEENIDSECNFGHSATSGKYCPFKIEALDNCSPGKTDRKYGFPDKKPCIFLKLNKVRLNCMTS